MFKSLRRLIGQALRKAALFAELFTTVQAENVEETYAAENDNNQSHSSLKDKLSARQIVLSEGEHAVTSLGVRRSQPTEIQIRKWKENNKLVNEYFQKKQQQTQLISNN